LILIKVERRTSDEMAGSKERTMTIKDIFLPLVGEPDAAAIAAIEKCVAVAGELGARVTAMAVQEDIPIRPRLIVSNDPEDTATIEAVRSVSDARGLLKAFDAAATRSSVHFEQILSRLASEHIASHLAVCARLRDLSLVPMKADDDRSERIVERLLFESGRPVVMCPEQFARRLPVTFNDVLIAWDNSAPAARAVADALPILQAAARVGVIVVTDEKKSATLGSAAALATHLALHGIKVSVESVEVGGSSIGKVFEACVKAHPIDLLVMGAYRHSRLHEMVWGGATKTVITRPPCWVLMSH
jgi:nucleotide-binding universal stress UspA family protein